MTRYVIGIRIPTEKEEFVQYYMHDDMFGQPLFTANKNNSPRFKMPNLANRQIHHLKNRYSANYFIELA